MAAKKRLVIVDLVRIILALVFIFSGFVKAVDPWGTAIKLGDYFAAFGMSWLEGGKFVFSVVLSSLELLLGLLLLFNLKVKGASFFVALFMLFFTILTLIIALTNPVADCGCFGDAVKLTNWETFLKNIILFPLSVLLFMSVVREGAHFPVSNGREWLLVILLAVFSSSIGIYSTSHLPVIDFLPYKTGVNIPHAMAIPEDADLGEYRTTLIYRDIETGDLTEFAVEDTTWYDTTRWEFVDSRSVEISRGYEPMIGEFSIFGPDGNVTLDILNDEQEVYIFVLTELAEMTERDYTEVKKITGFAETNGGRTIYVTSSPLGNFPGFERRGIDIEGYNMDATLMKMFLRARKGLVVMDRGTILAKWNIKDIPSLSKLGDTTVKDYVVTKQRKDSVKEFFIFYGVILLFLLVFRRSLCRRR